MFLDTKIFVFLCDFKNNHIKNYLYLSSFSILTVNEEYNGTICHKIQLFLHPGDILNFIIWNDSLQLFQKFMNSVVKINLYFILIIILH